MEGSVDERGAKLVRSKLELPSESEEHANGAKAADDLELQIVAGGRKFVPITEMLGVRQDHEHEGQHNQEKLSEYSQHTT